MANTSPKKILIVDDNEDVLNPLSNILKRANYNVISTNKGKAAVELAINELPDLIVLDIVMPDMGGSEVAALLVENPSTTNIPIIFLTGILSKQEDSLVKRPNKYYVMAKPVTGKELLEMVEKTLTA